MVSFNMHGVIAPVFTPFYDDGRINLEPIPQYAKFLVENGIQNVLVGGTTGEFVSLHVEEKKIVLDAWLKQAKIFNLKIMVHVGGAPLPYVIEMAKYAEQVKVDAIMTLPELYFKPKTPEQLVAYLELVSKAAPSTPLVYYNNPLMSGVEVGNYPAFFKLAKSRIPTFMGILVLAPSVLMGHDSSIATVTTIFPKLVMDTVESAKAGDVEKARSLQARLNDLVQRIMVAGNYSTGEFVPSMKVVMEFISGVKVGPPRLPQYPLDSQRADKIRKTLGPYVLGSF